MITKSVDNKCNEIKESIGKVGAKYETSYSKSISIHEYSVKTVTYNKYVGVTGRDESKFSRTSIISNYYLKLKIIS